MSSWLHRSIKIQPRINMQKNKEPEIKYTYSEIINYCLDKYNLTTFSKNGKYVAVMLESRFYDNIKILLITK